MIAYLEGELYEKRPEYVILKVGGVGYRTFIPLSTFYQLPEPPDQVTLHVYTHVQTDTLQLYGFATQDEKQTFIKLLAIPRVGPKLALSILSGISPQPFFEPLIMLPSMSLPSVRTCLTVTRLIKARRRLPKKNRAVGPGTTPTAALDSA